MEITQLAIAAKIIASAFGLSWKRKTAPQQTRKRVGRITNPARWVQAIHLNPRAISSNTFMIVNKGIMKIAIAVAS